MIVQLCSFVRLINEGKANLREIYEARAETRKICWNLKRGGRISFNDFIKFHLELKILGNSFEARFI